MCPDKYVSIFSCYALSPTFQLHLFSIHAGMMIENHVGVYHDKQQNICYEYIVGNYACLCDCVCDD